MSEEADPLVVIVAYHNTAQLAAGLASLGPGHPLVVVDNGADADVARLVRDYEGRYIAPRRNVGFAAGVNIALSENRGRDVLLLNPDARVSADMPQALVAVLRADPRIAAVAPRLSYLTGEPQRVVWPVPSPREAWIDALNLRRARAPRQVFMIGAVLLLRAEALTDVGLFDERFFLYSEECDWQLRAVRRGWQLKLADDLVAIHTSSGSSEFESVREHHFHKSAELFGRKWYGPGGWASMRAAFLLGTAVRLGMSLHRPARRAHYARQLRL